MNTKIILFFGLLALATLCTARPAEEEYEYEEEPAPPPKKVPARPLVGKRTNPLAGRKALSTTTTTTTAAPQQEEEEVPAEGDYEDEQPVETSSTTETSKKYIRGGIIRPFRSNNDLLESLKKRREQVVSTKQSKPIASPSEQKEEVASSEPVQKETKPAGRRNRFSKGKASSNDVAAVADSETSSPAAPARTARGRFSSRS